MFNSRFFNLRFLAVLIVALVLVVGFASASTLTLSPNPTHIETGGNAIPNTTVTVDFVHNAADPTTLNQIDFDLGTGSVTKVFYSFDGGTTWSDTAAAGGGTNACSITAGPPDTMSCTSPPAITAIMGIHLVVEGDDDPGN